AMDTFGPISDNANGIFEMSGALKERGNQPAAGGLTGDKIVHRLDSVGNTTKALTKGFAIATAVVAAVALFHSFVEDSRLVELINIATRNGVALKDAFGGLPVDVPVVFIGLLIGGAAPFLFSAFSIMAVGRSAFEMIHEVRRQFREKPGIMQGTEMPDYGRCVEIVTAAAQKELLGPGILAIALPVAVGFGLSIGASPVQIGGSEYVFTGAQALGGYLAGAILSGQLLAVLLANSGGAWDNAKKRIEDGFLGGKGTDAHKAGVIGDTVGDPFKDTAGPALNPLIKVMNLVAILIAPIVIQPLPDAVRIGVTAVAVGALLFSVYWSKRGSVAETIEHELGYHTMEDEYAPVGGKGGA
ncbi:MAG: sodium/proton-translocating pyrophosphatase, partial [Fimbriimonadales bacterium]